MKPFYETYQAASHAAQLLQLKSTSQYRRHYKKDSKLPRKPDEVYRPEFQNKGGWYGFLGNKIPIFYKTYSEASEAVQRLGFKSHREYRQYYQKDPKLPSAPNTFYQHDFQNHGRWVGFLGINYYSTYEAASNAAQDLNIKSKDEYLKRYHEDPKLPRNPDTFYKPQYQRNKGLYGFLNLQLPFTTSYISPNYCLWKDRIDEFLQSTKNRPGKQYNLCKFERLYIEANELEDNVEDLILNEGADLQLFRDFLDHQPRNQREKIHNTVHEFIDWIIREHLVGDKNAKSVDIHRNSELKNPFLSFQIEPVSKNYPSQTVRSLLPFHYLKKVREWIIPPQAKSFRDLKHLFNSSSRDWVKIDESIIDYMDPSCVWKKQSSDNTNDQFFLWSPMNWMHVYALIMTGLRGIMIAYSDSGEADKEIPILDSSGKIAWISNPNPMAGETNRQCIISRFEEDQIGIFTPVNKAGDGNGFSCPWMDETLAYWLIQLRQWQSHFNPIMAPTAWTQLTRLNSYNLKQKQDKGRNCFLFREFGKDQPPCYSRILSQLIAVALYNIQDDELELATVTPGKEQVYSHYNSKYTPHSIRGSFITALIIEGGLSPIIVMKIVAHRSLCMTAYYCKPDNVAIRQKITAAQKQALQNQTLIKQTMIEQGRIDEISNELIGNDSTSTLYKLFGKNSAVHPASYVFSDLGLCPYAGARCHEGGKSIGTGHQHAPVPEGYLGYSNCPQCRFFITGPAWIGGLLSFNNEILLAANKQSEQYKKLEEIKKDLIKHLNRLEEEEYDAELDNRIFDNNKQTNLRQLLRKTEADIEKAALKLDSYLCDIQEITKLIRQCHALINQQSSTAEAEVKNQLIVPTGMKLHIECEEVSIFQQFNEVCENSEIYQSANAAQAITSRSQLLDRMAEFNEISPALFKLNEVQQLLVGNQITQLLLSRLKSWERVNRFMEGKITLKDLNENECIRKTELKALFYSKNLIEKCLSNDS